MDNIQWGWTSASELKLLSLHVGVNYAIQWHVKWINLPNSRPTVTSSVAVHCTRDVSWSCNWRNGLKDEDLCIAFAFFLLRLSLFYLESYFWQLGNVLKMYWKQLLSAAFTSFTMQFFEHSEVASTVAQAHKEKWNVLTVVKYSNEEKPFKCRFQLFSGVGTASNVRWSCLPATAMRRCSVVKDKCSSRHFNALPVTLMLFPSLCFCIVSCWNVLSEVGHWTVVSSSLFTFFQRTTESWDLAQTLLADIPLR